MFYMGALHPTDPELSRGLGSVITTMTAVHEPATGWRYLVKRAGVTVSDSGGEGEVAISGSSRPGYRLDDHTTGGGNTDRIFRTLNGGRTATTRSMRAIDKSGLDAYRAGSQVREK